MKAIQRLQLFLDQYFEGRSLNPPLFPSWKNALRFELLDSEASGSNPKLLEQALQRAITLFEEVFADEDDILTVADVTTKETHRFISNRPLSVYRTFVKDEETLHQLRHELLQNPENLEMVTHRLALPCRKRDIRYQLLLEVICHEEIRQPLTNLREEPDSYYDLYLLNVTRGIIFHVYNKLY